MTKVLKSSDESIQEREEDENIILRDKCHRSTLRSNRGDTCFEANSKNKARFRPLCLDADGWRKSLTSNVHVESGRCLRKAIANLKKKMCTEDINDKSFSKVQMCFEQVEGS